MRPEPTLGHRDHPARMSMISAKSERDRTGQDAVSLVIPAFNRHESLTRAILSAAKQMDTFDEILVADDGSSPAIDLSDLPPIAPTLRLLRSERNVGPASARNLALRCARKPLIAFLDSDDEWLPGKLEAQKAILAADPSPLLAVAGGWQETRNGFVLRKRIPCPSSSRSDFFAGTWFCPGSTLLLRREAFAICGLFADGLRRLEDYEWFLRFALAGGRLAITEHIGASISRGGNARPQPVEEAASVIVARHADAPSVSAAERRAVFAYLDLERSAAYRNAGQPDKAFVYFCKSLARRPRWSAPLKNWWHA